MTFIEALFRAGIHVENADKLPARIDAFDSDDGWQSRLAGVVTMHHHSGGMPDGIGFFMTDRPYVYGIASTFEDHGFTIADLSSFFCGFRCATADKALEAAMKAGCNSQRSAENRSLCIEIEATRDGVLVDAPKGVQ